MKRYDLAFKLEAVKLADDIGVSKAAKDLKIPYSTIETWQRKARAGEFAGMEPSPEAALSLAEENKRLRQKIKELERTNEILAEATSFFANRQKK